MAKRLSLNITHDIFVKKVLSNNSALQSFLRGFLPENIQSLLDIDALKKTDKSFITEVLRERFADIVYSVPLRDSASSIQVAMLVEHKFHPDKFVVFQILEYLALAYRSQADNTEGLQLIVPIVYYHGEEKWESRNIASFFTEFPEDLQIFIPNFEHIFVNLSKLSIEQIGQLENSLLQTALRIQLLQFLKSIDAKLLLAVFSEFDYKQYGNYFLAILVYSYKHLDIDNQEFDKFVTELPDYIKTEAMTIAERLEKRGFAKGIEEGIEKGIAKGREEGIESKTIAVVLKCYENGMTLSQICNISDLPEEKVIEILAANGKKM